MKQQIIANGIIKDLSGVSGHEFQEIKSENAALKKRTDNQGLRSCRPWYLRQNLQENQSNTPDILWLRNMILLLT